VQNVHTHEHDHEHEHHHVPARLDAQAWLKAGLMLGLGLYFVWIIVSGNLTNYINYRFAWLVYIAATVLLLLGVASVVGLLRRPAHHDHDESCGCGHDHAHDGHGHSHGVSWGTLGIIALPLLLGTLVPSRPLGAEAIDGNLSMTAASAATVTEFMPDPLKRNVLDWLRAFNSAEDYNELNGLPADVVGFVYREPTFAADTFMLARFTVSCCVADASAIGIPVLWPEGADVQQNTWLRVQGDFQVGDFRGEAVPVLHAKTVETMEQPEHPYLYP
jgi:putative membrane protein